MGNLYLPDSGSKVNGLEQLIQSGGFNVTYCTFQMALEVVEKKEGYEVAFRWISSRKKAETFYLRKLKKVLGIDFAILSICPDTMKSSKSSMLKFAPL